MRPLAQGWFLNTRLRRGQAIGRLLFLSAYPATGWRRSAALSCIMSRLTDDGTSLKEGSLSSH